MTALDLGLVVLVLLALVAGFRVGLVARIASWAGLIAGVLATWWTAPQLLAVLPTTEPRLRFVAVLTLGLTLLVMLSAGFSLLGGRVRRWIRRWIVLDVIDRSAGAVAGVLVLALLVWVLAPIAAAVPGGLARQVRSSVAVAAMAEFAPPPPDAVGLVRRAIDLSGIPLVLDVFESAPAVGSPPGDLDLAGPSTQQAAASVVRIDARGCNRRSSGSGFVLDTNLVVTNAHVVAGAEALLVHTPRGLPRDAEVVAFDADRDLALLAVDGLDLPALARGPASVQSHAFVIGHPGGQETQRVAPVRIDRRREAIGRDIFDDRPASRRVLVLAADLERGDSGAPVIDAEGRVVGVVFAVSPDRPTTAFALDDTELDAFLAQPISRAEASRCLM